MHETPAPPVTTPEQHQPVPGVDAMQEELFTKQQLMTQDEKASMSLEDRVAVFAGDPGRTGASGADILNNTGLTHEDILKQGYGSYTELESAVLARQSEQKAQADKDGRQQELRNRHDAWKAERQAHRDKKAQDVERAREAVDQAHGGAVNARAEQVAYAERLKRGGANTDKATADKIYVSAVATASEEISRDDYLHVADKPREGYNVPTNKAAEARQAELAELLRRHDNKVLNAAARPNKQSGKSADESVVPALEAGRGAEPIPEQSQVVVPAPEVTVSRPRSQSRSHDTHPRAAAIDTSATSIDAHHIRIVGQPVSDIKPGTRSITIRRPRNNDTEEQPQSVNDQVAETNIANPDVQDAQQDVQAERTHVISPAEQAPAGPTPESKEDRVKQYVLDTLRDHILPGHGMHTKDVLSYFQRHGGIAQDQVLEYMDALVREGILVEGPRGEGLIPQSYSMTPDVSKARGQSEDDASAQGPEGADEAAKAAAEPAIPEEPKEPEFRKPRRGLGKWIGDKRKNAVQRFGDAGYYLAEDYEGPNYDQHVGKRAWKGVKGLGKPPKDALLAGSGAMANEAARLQEIEIVREQLRKDPGYKFLEIGNPDSSTINAKKFEKRIAREARRIVKQEWSADPFALDEFEQDDYQPKYGAVIKPKQEAWTERDPKPKRTLRDRLVARNRNRARGRTVNPAEEAARTANKPPRQRSKSRSSGASGAQLSRTASDTLDDLIDAGSR